MQRPIIIYGILLMSLLSACSTREPQEQDTLLVVFTETSLTQDSGAQTDPLRSFILNTASSTIDTLPFDVSSMGSTDRVLFGRTMTDTCGAKHEIRLGWYDVVSGRHSTTCVPWVGTNPYYARSVTKMFGVPEIDVLLPIVGEESMGDVPDSTFTIINHGRLSTVVGLENLVASLRTKRTTGRPTYLAWEWRSEYPSGGDGGPDDIFELYVLDISTGDWRRLDSFYMELIGRRDVILYDDVMWTSEGKLSYAYSREQDFLIHVLYDPVSGVKTERSFPRIANHFTRKNDRLKVRVLNGDLYISSSHEIHIAKGNELVEIFRSDTLEIEDFFVVRGDLK